MSEVSFINLNRNNCDEVVEIYNYYVTETTVSYATDAISNDEFISYYQIENPLTMAYNIMIGSDVVGFCMLKPWNARKLAYQQTYEFTIYIKKECCHMGLGRKAFYYIEDRALEKKIAVIMAGVSYDNVNSYKMFESVGFERCGHLKKVGRKFGEFLDLYYYQKVYVKNCVEVNHESRA